MKLRCGELASNSYEKLKELLNIGGRSTLRLDRKGLLKSLGTELLVQEDWVLSTRGKRKGDLNKERPYPRPPVQVSYSRPPGFRFLILNPP